MHAAQRVADQLLAGLAGSAITGRALTAVEANALRAAALQDATDAIFSGSLTIAEAAQALDRRQFTWSTVKLYYSVFYLMRSTLALNGTCIVYSKTTPYTWTCSAGQVPKKRSGTTHKAALDAFTTNLPNHVLISQPIGVDAPLDWLVARREEANYKLLRFTEPNAPEHFKIVERYGVRRSIRDYISDQGHVFTFDPDHAMLSFPIAAMKEALMTLPGVAGSGLSADDCSFIARQCYDKAGPVPDFRTLLGVP